MASFIFFLPSTYQLLKLPSSLVYLFTTDYLLQTESKLQQAPCWSCVSLYTHGPVHQGLSKNTC